MKRKGNIPINVSFNMLVGIVVIVVALSVIIPLLMAQEGNTGCVGMIKWIGTAIADTTGYSLC